MTHEELARRGDEAKRLLEEPLLIEAFEVIEEEFTELWKQTKASDADAREKLWLSIRMLQKVQGHLKTALETGKASKATLLQRAADMARETGRKLW